LVPSEEQLCDEWLDQYLDTVRVAVIGAGRMASVRVADLVADPRVAEVQVINRTRSRAAELAERFGARVMSWDDFDPTAVDATVVTLATAAHADVLRRVLAGGRPVLCEKPIALGLVETAEIMDLAAGLGSPLQVGFQRRFDPGVRDLHERIHDGRLGILYALRIISHDHEPSTPEFITGSGGIFCDLHVHDLDLVRWLTGSEIDSVYATSAVRAHPQYAEAGDADVSLVHAVTTSGVQVSIHGARHDPLGLDVRVEAFGQLDSVAAGTNRRTPIHLLDDEGHRPLDPYSGFVDRFRTAFAAETAAFVRLVTQGGPNPCPPEAALESLRAAIACQQSARTGQVVPVREIGAPG
jgi:myo-inositol 2-dehydrogenase / D-chiro-inositol 1-dehydrogenase